MIRRVKAILPEAAVKAFTAIELSYMIRKAGLAVDEGLRLLIEAGMKPSRAAGPRSSTKRSAPEYVPTKAPRPSGSKCTARRTRRV